MALSFESCTCSKFVTISFVNYWVQILEFLSALVDDQDVITILIEPLIKVGLVDCAIGLLLNELEKSMDGNNLDRYDFCELKSELTSKLQKCTVHVKLSKK